MSYPSPIACGVPQGSILGPLLFLLFINDMPDSIKFSNVKLYADDAVLYQACDNVDETIRSQSLDNTNFIKWCAKNKLTINNVKTKCMWLTGKLKLDPPELPIKINGQILEYTNCFKYLGLWIDKQLSFENHVTALQTKLKKQAKGVKKCRKYLSTYQSMFLYKTLLIPLLDYADIFYNSCNQSQLNQLQIIQNKIIRACHSKKEWTNTLEIHRKHHILTLNRRRKLHLAKWGFQLSLNKCNLKVYKRALRKNGKRLLEIPPSKFKFIDKSLSVSIPSIWNDLPEYIRLAKKKEEFVHLMTDWLWQDQLATQ